MDNSETISLEQVTSAYQDNGQSQERIEKGSSDWDLRHYGDLEVFEPWVTDAAHFVEYHLCRMCNSLQKSDGSLGQPDWPFIKRYVKSQSRTPRNQPYSLSMLFPDIEEFSRIQPHKLHEELRAQILLSDEELILMLSIWGTRRSISSYNLILGLTQVIPARGRYGQLISITPSVPNQIADLSDYHLMKIISDPRTPPNILHHLETTFSHKVQRVYKRISTRPNNLL